MNVPTYSPQVRAGALPTVRFADNATAAAFGGQRASDLNRLGGALEGAGSAMSNEAAKWQEKVNLVKVRDAVNQAETAALSLQTEIRMRQGKDAVGASEYAKQKLGDTQKELMKGLGNTKQQEMFTSVFQGIHRQTVGNASTHETLEFDKYDTQTKLAENKLRIEDAVANWNTPGKLEQNLKLIEANTVTLNQKSGLPADSAAAQENIQKARDVYHQQIVLGMLKTDTPAGRQSAKKYMEDLKKAAENDKTRERADTDLLHTVSGPALAELNQQMQNVLPAQEAWDQFRQMKAEGKTMKQMLAAVDKIDDPKTAQLLRSHIHTNDSEQKSLVEDAQRASASAAYATYAKTGQVPTLEQVGDPQVYLKLVEMKERDAADRARLHQAQRGSAEYRRLYLMDPLEMRKMTGPQMFDATSSLPEKERGEIMKKWETGQDPEPLVKDGITAFNQATDKRRLAANKNPDDDVSFQKFHSAVQDDLRELVLAKKINTKEEAKTYALKRSAEHLLTPGLFGKSETLPEKATPESKPGYVWDYERDFGVTAVTKDGGRTWSAMWQGKMAPIPDPDLPMEAPKKADVPAYVQVYEKKFGTAAKQLPGTQNWVVRVGDKWKEVPKPKSLPPVELPE
jgi:Tfp pilus assembly protein PilX